MSAFDGKAEIARAAKRAVAALKDSCPCRKSDPVGNRLRIPTILRWMCDLCRLIFGLVVDLFRSRAALEAEVLVLSVATGQAKSDVIFGRRQVYSGLGLPPVSEGPRRARHRSTRYRGSVAPYRLPIVLALAMLWRHGDPNKFTTLSSTGLGSLLRVAIELFEFPLSLSVTIRSMSGFVLVVFAHSK